jgi:hypothetical protein
MGVVRIARYLAAIQYRVAVRNATGAVRVGRYLGQDLREVTRREPVQRAPACGAHSLQEHFF